MSTPSCGTANVTARGEWGGVAVVEGTGNTVTIKQ